MEWLHKIAHALGGQDVPENLVAATREANRIMLVFERMAMAVMNQGRRVEVEASASMKVGSRVGHELRYVLRFEAPDGTMVTVLEGTIDLATRERVPKGAFTKKESLGPKLVDQ